MSYVKDTLKMYPNLHLKIIPAGIHLHVENLIFPEVRKWSISIAPDTISLIKKKVLEYAESHFKLKPNYGDKIYISRKKTGKRGFTNELEVEKIITKYGFNSVYFEDHNIYEQALIMNKAKYVVGLHGAGFANIIYMNTGNSIFEIIAHPPEINEHRTGYWRLSGIIGLNYYCQFCDIDVKNNVVEILNNDLIANTELLEKNIKTFISNENQ